MVFGTRKNSNKANHHLWTPIVSDYDNCQSDAESSCTRWNEKNVFARSEKFLRYLSDIIKYIMVSNNKVNAKFVYKFIYIFENNIFIIINNMFIIIKNSKIKSNIILLFNIRCTTLLPPFFFRNSRILYCKKLVIHLWFKVLSIAFHYFLPSFG